MLYSYLKTVLSSYRTIFLDQENILLEQNIFDFVDSRLIYPFISVQPMLRFFFYVLYMLVDWDIEQKDAI